MDAHAEPRADRPARLQVVTPIFEGPLELLLALVEREDLDILQVPLAHLTEAYLAELAAIPEPDSKEIADFLWMAARLLLLKSIRLLPGEEPTPEIEELLTWEEDVRQRLQEYRTYRALAQAWMESIGNEMASYPPPARPIELEGQEVPIEANLLVTAFQSVISRIPPRPLTLVKRTWSMDEKVSTIERRLRAGRLDLVELLLESEDRLEAVVTFVALLELLRRGEVSVRQDATYGSIWVTARPNSAPEPVPGPQPEAEGAP